jgi:calcium/calmodulin-dependent protein kinase I
LTFDPNHRITAEEALLHPWITGSKEAGPRNSTNLAPVIRRGYSSRGSFTAIALMNRFKASDESSSEEEKEIKNLDISI